MLNNKLVVAMLRQLRGQIARPFHISQSNEAYRYCMDNGLVKFNEWPAGHYEITDKGRSFIQSAQENEGERA